MTKKVQTPTKGVIALTQAEYDMIGRVFDAALDMLGDEFPQVWLIRGKILADQEGLNSRVALEPAVVNFHEDNVLLDWRDREVLESINKKFPNW